MDFFPNSFICVAISVRFSIKSNSDLMVKLFKVQLFTTITKGFFVFFGKVPISMRKMKLRFHRQTMKCKRSRKRKDSLIFHIISGLKTDYSGLKAH